MSKRVGTVHASTGTSSAHRLFEIKATALTVAVAVGIAYGSLFPFRFYRTQGNPCAALLATWRSFSGWGDMAENVLLYFPLGFLAFRAYHPSSGSRVLPAFVPSLMLSSCIELAQFYDLSRSPEMADIYANTLGATLGIAAAEIIQVAPMGKTRLWLASRLKQRPSEAILLCCWCVYQLFPYVIAIDPHIYKHAVSALLASKLSISALYLHTTLWLIIGLVLDSLLGLTYSRLALPALITADVFGRSVLLGSILPGAEVEGGMLAAALWAVFLSRSERRVVIVIMLLFGAVALDGFQLYDFVPVANCCIWVPFSNFMSGSLAFNLRSLFYRVFICGSLVWLPVRIGYTWTTSVCLAVLIVLARDCINAYASGRVPDVTNTLILLITAVTIKIFTEGTKYQEETAPHITAAP